MRLAASGKGGLIRDSLGGGSRTRELPVWTATQGLRAVVPPVGRSCSFNNAPASHRCSRFRGVSRSRNWVGATRQLILWSLRLQAWNW